MLLGGILQFFKIFHKEEKITYEKEFFRYANDVLKSAISGTSWCLYVIAVLLIASCLYFLYFERRSRRAHQQRMREIQLMIEKTPQKRRPGAVAREREVYQNVLKTAHSYIYPNGDEQKLCVVRQTRSGTIYGKFTEDKKIK